MAQGGLSQASAAGDAAKLPRLRPHLNRKAQEVIAAHMRSGSSSSSAFSAATVHVLSKIDSTSSRKARSHDISHLLDGAPCLAPRIPPSLIADEDHVYEKRFLPEEVGSTYNDQDGMWYVKVFPSDKPSSRTDAVMLDAWITRSLERYSRPNTLEDREDLAKTVEALVPILSVGLHELVRQVSHHCAERGVALEKVWRTYVELFDRVLRQMRDSLQEQRRRTSETQRRLQEVKAELREVKRRHPEDMQNAIQNLESSFMQRQQDQEQELRKASDENIQLQQELKQHRTEMDIWFPGFSFYQDSYIKNALPQRSFGRAGTRACLHYGGGSQPGSRAASKASPAADEAEKVSEAAEVAFAEDLKRLLAVLGPEKRRIIGQELAFIMETTDSAMPSPAGTTRRRAASTAAHLAKAAGGEQDEKARLEAETLDLLRSDIRMQEERILHLREEISRVETGHVDEVEELLAGMQKRQLKGPEPEMNLSLGEELGRYLSSDLPPEHASEKSGGHDDSG